MEFFIESGDRWVVHGITPHTCTKQIFLGQSCDMLISEDTEILFEHPKGTFQPARYCSGNLVLDKGFVVDTHEGICLTSLQITNTNPLTFQFVSEPLKPLEAPCTIIEHDIPIFLENDSPVLHKEPVSWELFSLSRHAALLASTPDFEKLMSQPLLHDVDVYDHQVKTVKKILQQFRGRGLLCDEVGLGKTVEACLILLELSVRRLARRTLILTPPSLVTQWQGELQRKFGLQFVAYDDPTFKQGGELSWHSHDQIIASYHTAKLEPYRSWIAQEQWDMVIIDEAHHLRNSKTLLWKFASSLQKKYILLLTATPMHNCLDDLYSLVTLLKPGLLNTAKKFKQQFGCKNDAFQVKNVDQLHTLISECMVRNRRATISVQMTKRFATTFRVTPSPEETSLYQEITEFVKTRLRQEKSSYSRISLLSLQKLIGSFPQAITSFVHQMLESSKKRGTDEKLLLAIAHKSLEQKESMKVKRLLALLEEFPDKIVIFTQFRATQEYLFDTLTKAGHATALFHGSLTRMQKEEAIRCFREEGRILLSTDSGSEGRNLQFCNAICNFDLPWNPMRIEQRIGRVSRLGQTRDVHIFNLVTAGTIEDDVLRILEAKINLFEQVVGEMDMIVGNLEEDSEFEEMVVNMWVQSETNEHFSQEMEKFGDRLVLAKEEYVRQQELENHVFGDACSVTPVR